MGPKSIPNGSTWSVDAFWCKKLHSRPKNENLARGGGQKCHFLIGILPNLTFWLGPAIWECDSVDENAISRPKYVCLVLSIEFRSQWSCSMVENVIFQRKTAQLDFLAKPHYLEMWLGDRKCHFTAKMCTLRGFQLNSTLCGHASWSKMPFFNGKRCNLGFWLDPTIWKCGSVVENAILKPKGVFFNIKGWNIGNNINTP